MGSRVDLTGKRFGRLIVTGYAGPDKYKNATWKCVCDCGNISVAAGCRLRAMQTKSCGCLWKEINTGITLSQEGKQTRLYQIWNGMKQRCSNKKHCGYHNYGGRGVRVCAEWECFTSFYKWATDNGYRDGLSIDRIDGNGNYAPGNCRWIPFRLQGMKTSRIHLLEFNGEVKSMAEWSRISGIPYSVLIARINRHGWTTEKALTTPIKPKEAV